MAQLPDKRLVQRHARYGQPWRNYLDRHLQLASGRGQYWSWSSSVIYYRLLHLDNLFGRHDSQFCCNWLWKNLAKPQIDVFRARIADQFLNNYHIWACMVLRRLELTWTYDRVPWPRHSLHHQKCPSGHLSRCSPRCQVCQLDCQVPLEAHFDQILLRLSYLLRVCLLGYAQLWRCDQLWCL